MDIEIDPLLFYSFWQKTVFYIVHKTTIWLLLVLLVTSGVTWHLGNILAKHNARAQEAKIAHKTSLGYAITAVALWIFNFVMS